MKKKENDSPAQTPDTIEKMESITFDNLFDAITGDLRIRREEAEPYLRRGYYLREELVDGFVILAKKIRIETITNSASKTVTKTNQQTGERLPLTGAEIKRFTRGSRFNRGYNWSVSGNLEYTFKRR